MKHFLKRVVISCLTFEAAWLLRRFKPTIVAVTGSVGKTSTKDAIYAAVKNTISTRKSEKSFNSDIGVPLTVLGLPNTNHAIGWLKNLIDGFFIALFSKEYPAVLILETGIDRPGDMDRLTKWLKPNIAVVTKLPSIPAHLEYFSSPQAVADEKMKLVFALNPEGTFIYNADDEIIAKYLPEVLPRKLSFSRYIDSDFRGDRDITLYADDIPIGMEYTLSHSGQSATVKIMGSLGDQHVYSSAAAVAVASVLGVTLPLAVEELKNLVPAPGRMRILPGIKQTTIIDDTYNSSPVAVESALMNLKETKAVRRIAVLGDMLELGQMSVLAHKKVGEQAARAVDVLLTVGVRSREIAAAALANGIKESNIFQFDSVEEAGRELQQMLAPGDLVLIKASQGIRSELIVEEVMAAPEQAQELLVRQDSLWLSKK
jgi:UDP-N-acetylmuramoyl-tripeptide--D-alanyl-D-alanine ligase